MQIITSAKMTIEICLARKDSNEHFNFYRIDYPLVDPPEWRRWVTIKLEEGHVKVGELGLDYHGDLVKNYKSHCGLPEAS